MNTSEKDLFKQFLESDELPGSGRASSYVRALDLLSQMLKAEPMGFADCAPIWHEPSVARLEKLFRLVREQTKAWESSPWRLPGLPPSYLRDGFCSAALGSFIQFLTEHRHSEALFEIYREHKGDEDALPQHLNKELRYPRSLIDEISPREGTDRIRSMKARVNQHAFRRIVLDLYGGACCITGLDVPEVNRASHILPWAESKTTRMDPRNGLCLSATYDAAFDRHLITLDEDYRLVVSRVISDHYTSDAVKSHFLDREGQRISLPERLRPSQEFLRNHRQRGHF